MTQGAPLSIATLVVIATVLAILTVLAYILKMRRRRFQVPFSTLWQRVLREKEATSLWHQFRRLGSLLLMLVILFLLLGAVLDPKLGSGHRDARSVVILLDASASMKTRDEGREGNRPRLEIGKQKATQVLDAMSGGDVAMIVRMDGQTTPLTRFHSDRPLLRKIASQIEATDTPADLGRALSAAADALRNRPGPLIVIIGDGGYGDEVATRVTWTPPSPASAAASRDAGAGRHGSEGRDAPHAGREDLAAIDLTGIDVRYLPVGQRGDNVAIVAFNVRRYLADKTTFEVFVEIQNFGDKKARRKLVVYSGRDPISVETVELAPGEHRRRIYPGLGGGGDRHLRAVLEGTDGEMDVFPLDDEAWALVPERTAQSVLLVTRDNLYLEGAMLVYDSVHEVDKLVPDEYEAAMATGGLPPYSVVVYDDYTPELLPPPPCHLLYFNPRGPSSPFPIQGSLPAGRITDVNNSHPVMRWITLSDVNFDAVSAFALRRDAGDVVLAQSGRAAVIAAREAGGRKIVAFGFALTATDLILRVAFPVLLVNALDWFAGDDADLITTYATGTRLRVPVAETLGAREARVRTPKGRTVKAPVSGGHALFYGGEIGVHTLTLVGQDGPVAEMDLAANLANPMESNIHPVRDLALGGRTLAPPDDFAFSRGRSVWPYLASLALLALVVEWVTYHRRVTV